MSDVDDDALDEALDMAWSDGDDDSGVSLGDEPANEQDSQAASSLPLEASGPSAAAPVPEEAEEEEPVAEEIVISRRKEEIFLALTEEERDRFEAVARAGLKQAKIKKLMECVAGGVNIRQPAVIAMAGIAKLFLGEVVETARLMAQREGDDGPLQPRHVRLAYHSMHLAGRIPRHRAVFSAKRRLLARR